MSLPFSSFFPRTQFDFGHTDATAAEEFLPVVYDCAPVGLCFIGPDLHYIMINRHFAAISGHLPEAYLGRPLNDFPSELSFQMEAACRLILETGTPIVDQVVEGHSPVNPTQVRQWQVSYYPAFDSMGCALGINTVVIDITEQREAIKRLADSERKFRLTTAVSQTVVFTLDLNFYYTWLHSDRVGYDPIEIIGKTDDYLFDPATTERLRSFYRDVVQTRARLVRDIEVQSLRRPAPQYFEMVVEPIFGQGGVIEGLACAAHEVSQRVQATLQAESAKACAERVSEAKSRLLTTVCHDLRQPVMSLSLFVEALTRESSDNPRLAAACAMMTDALGWLERLLSELMAYGALEMGRVEVRRRAVDLAGLLRRIGAEMQSNADSGGLRLRVRSPQFIVETDAVLLERILRNLVGNAIRYTERGGVLLGARRRGRFVHIEIYDTGTGIPDSQLATIFEEFQQLDVAIRKSAEGRGERGMGLGLAIVSRTAELLGHGISVRTRQGSGSVFSIEVPLSERDPCL
ncbi:MAG: PAS domain-containing protein [Rhodospirillaceae bacterium]